MKEKPNAHSSPFCPSEKKAQSNCWETNCTIKSSNCKLYQARMVDSILLHNVENSCLSDSSSVHGHTNTHNTHERRSSLRETAFTFQTSSTQNPNLRLQEENRKRKKKKRLVTNRDRQKMQRDWRHRQRQTESTLPIRSSKPCTSLGLAVTMTDSLSMFRISVFLCNILGCPAAAAAIS